MSSPLNYTICLEWYIIMIISAIMLLLGAVFNIYINEIYRRNRELRRVKVVSLVEISNV
jgi:hypothetical protein